MADQQSFTFKVDKRLSDPEKQALGLEVIDFILQRTEKGLDKNNSPFPGYSESYVSSLDFKLGGKSKGKVNLNLSGEMLGALEVLEVRENEIVIGIDKGDDFNNAKAEGNIKGSYGGKPNPKKRRDFMGIAKGDLNDIKKNYSARSADDREKSRQRALDLLVSSGIAKDLVDALSPETGGDNG